MASLVGPEVLVLHFQQDMTLTKADAVLASAFIFFWLLAFGAALWFSHVLRTSPDLKKALLAAVVTIVFLVFVSAAMVAMHLTRMTQRILLAIEMSMFDRRI